MKNYLKQKIKKKKKIKIDIKFKKYMIRIVQIFERYLIKNGLLIMLVKKNIVSLKKKE